MITSDEYISPTSLVCEQNFLHLHFLCVGILFNSTALGIHFCETSLIFNFKTRLGGEICLCDVNMHKGYLHVFCCQLHRALIMPISVFIKFDQFQNLGKILLGGTIHIMSDKKAVTPGNSIGFLRPCQVSIQQR